MGLESIGAIIGVIFFVFIYFFVVAFFGILALIVENWLIIGIGALLYWFFRKFIHKYLHRLRKNRIYSTILIIITVFAAGIVIILGLHAAMTRYSEKVYSPDGIYYVQAAEVNGGAMTSYQTSVSISDAKYILNNFGTANHETVLFFSGDVDSAKPTWIDNRTLKIRYECARLYDEPVTKWRDIKIIFEKEC